MGGGECKRKCISSKAERILYPNDTTISFKNLKNAVNLNDNKPNTAGCENIYITDVRKKHIRNRRLLDLPFKRAKCCADIYNAIVDRQKLKKLQKFNLSRPVRTVIPHLEPEGIKKYKCQENGEEKPIHVVNEFFNVFESDSDDNSEEGNFIIKKCESGSISECSGCSTLGECQKLKNHKIPKLRWQDLLKEDANLICKKLIPKEMKKYKGRADAKLELQKKLFS